MPRGVHGIGRCHVGGLARGHVFGGSGRGDCAARDYLKGGTAMICIVCRAELPNAPNVPNQPIGGVEFTTPGHYGCCVFDPMDGTKLAVNICDCCLDAARIRGDVLHVNGNRYETWK